MNHQINSYFAVLLITIVGAGASLIIIHVAYSNAFEVVMSSSMTYDVPLQPGAATR